MIEFEVKRFCIFSAHFSGWEVHDISMFYNFSRRCVCLLFHLPLHGHPLDRLRLSQLHRQALRFKFKFPVKSAYNLQLYSTKRAKPAILTQLL